VTASARSVGRSGPEDILPTYEAVGPAWAARRTKCLFERPALDRFLAALPGPRVLDAGCGSGDPIARHLVARGAAVTGIDGAAAMVALFRANLPDCAAAVADMRSLSLGGRFDGILAWDSLFHLSADDQRATLHRFGAHAADDAALMFTSGPAAGEAIGTVEGRPVYHASLSPDDYRASLRAAGFVAVEFRAEDPDVGHRSIWLARYVGRSAASALSDAPGTRHDGGRMPDACDGGGTAAEDTSDD
jgi:SAM-dependent methyltransferase